jgi:hypothetical protein
MLFGATRLLSQKAFDIQVFFNIIREYDLVWVGKLKYGNKLDACYIESR